MGNSPYPYSIVYIYKIFWYNCKMIKSVRFIPQDVAPQLIVATPNHLGSPLYSETDTQFREHAQSLANDLGALVIGYERPGTGSGSRTFHLGLPHRLQPSRYIEEAAQTGRQLEAITGTSSLRKIHAGDSAGAVDVVMVALAQEFSANDLVLAKPAGLKQMSRTGFGIKWLRNQLSENWLEAESTLLNASESSASPSLGEMIKRATPEVVLYLDSWRSSVVLEGLCEITTNRAFERTSVNLAFTAEPFILTETEQLVVVDSLNKGAPADRLMPFRAHILPDTRLSYFNATQSHIDLIKDTLSSCPGVVV